MFASVLNKKSIYKFRFASIFCGKENIDFLILKKEDISIKINITQNSKYT
jgi:hypothetical protein